MLHASAKLEHPLLPQSEKRSEGAPSESPRLAHSLSRLRRKLRNQKLCFLRSARSRLCELELELIQSQMAQKPMLRGEVGARA